MANGTCFGACFILFVILIIESFASAAPWGGISDSATEPSLEDAKDGYCPYNNLRLDPAAEGSANCQCHWKFEGSNKVMLKDVLPKACEKISSYEYGFDSYARRVMAPVPPTLIMVEYNRNFKGEACKGPRNMTQEQCENNFRNATWYGALTLTSAAAC